MHPAKYHFFKHTINKLINEGHSVKVIIISKDVLEPLVQDENWDYINIFPNGRRSKSENKTSIIFTTLKNFFLTLYKLFKIVSRKNFDLIITDDVVSIVAKIKRVKCITFTDNEISTVPESRLFLYFSDIILKPLSAELEKYKHKTLSFNAYKESAYLHPNYFEPKINTLKKNGIKEDEIFYFIRVVSMTASHDIGIEGLSDSRLIQIINILKKSGKVLISAERKLPEHLEPFLIKAEPNDVLNLLHFATIFIGDSGTMSSEAAILGTPTLMFHDFIGKLGVMREKEEKYQIMYGFNNNEFDELVLKLNELISTSGIKKIWKERVTNMIMQQEDVNEFLYNVCVKN